MSTKEQEEALRLLDKLGEKFADEARGKKVDDGWIACAMWCGRLSTALAIWAPYFPDDIRAKAEKLLEEYDAHMDSVNRAGKVWN